MVRCVKELCGWEGEDHDALGASCPACGGGLVVCLSAAVKAMVVPQGVLP